MISRNSPPTRWGRSEIPGEIREGPIAPEEALSIAGHVAAALEAAHEQGIVHRDLKPGNIKIKPDGAVKVLDFGLAKLVEPSGPERSPEDSPTLTLQQATRNGLILGTAAYMSPEQARGRSVDKRTDIWAFGVVLHEMLTGQQLFRGETVSDTLAAVLTNEPDLDRVALKTRPLLRRCLEKDPKRRLRDIGDAMPLLEDAPEAIEPSAHRVPWIWRTAAAFFLITTAAVSLIHFREARPAPAQPMRFQVPLPENASLPPPRFAVSPDGRRLVFFATGSDGVRRLWLRALDSVDAMPLHGSETTREGNRQVPFWSPDSRYVAFEAGGQIKKIDVSGGPPQALCKVIGGIEGGSWNRDDVIIFASGLPASGLMRVSAAGGAAAAVTFTGERSERQVFPTFLPDGKHFLYIRTLGPERSGIFVGSLDARPEQQDSRRLLATVGNYTPLYVPSPNSDVGHLLFLRDGTLVAQSFDHRRLRLSGEAAPVAGQAGPFDPWGFSASNSGVLVYRNDVQRRQLKWFDRQGRVLGVVGRSSDYMPQIALSPDGTRVATGQSNRLGNPPHIWLVDLATGTNTRLTSGSISAMRPVWSADSSHIAFMSLPRSGVYQRAASGAGDEEVLIQTNESTTPTDWSRDGHYLLYTSLSAKTKHDLWALPLGGDRKPFQVLGTEFDETRAVFSPDARWIAYVSDESGREEIYVTRFTSPSAGGASLPGGKWMVSKDGGVRVRWRRDGKELFYLTSDGTIVAVEVKTEPVFQAGVRQPLFRAPAETFGWDVAADGKQFLVAAGAAQGPLPPFTVVLNWTAALKKP